MSFHHRSASFPPRPLLQSFFHQSSRLLRPQTLHHASSNIASGCEFILTWTNVGTGCTRTGPSRSLTRTVDHQDRILSRRPQVTRPTPASVVRKSRPGGLSPANVIVVEPEAEKRGASVSQNGNRLLANGIRTRTSLSILKFSFDHPVSFASPAVPKPLRARSSSLCHIVEVAKVLMESFAKVADRAPLEF